MQRVANEVAEAEFQRFAETMDLEVDPAEMNEEDRKGFELQKRRMIKAIEAGSLAINDAGEPVFSPTRSDCGPITFSEPTGAAFMAMDQKKKTEDVGKMYAIMASISGQPAGTFAKMKNADLKVCMAVVTLFLG